MPKGFQGYGDARPQVQPKGKQAGTSGSKHSWKGLPQNLPKPPSGGNLGGEGVKGGFKRGGA